jgi:hypothetical protein
MVPRAFAPERVVRARGDEHSNVNETRTQASPKPRHATRSARSTFTDGESTLQPGVRPSSIDATKLSTDRAVDRS